MKLSKKLKIGLVVPSLELGGGVPSVAEFVCRCIERAPNFEYQLVSLATSASDDIGVLLRKPTSWRQGPQTLEGIWRNRPFTRVGAVASELEFQRFMPRAVLTELLSDCDLIQVVCGSPAWANAVIGLGKPVSLQVATRAKIERKMRDSRPYTLPSLWRKGMTYVTDRLDDRALRNVDAIQLENPWMLSYSEKLNVGRSSVDIRYASPGIDDSVFYPLSFRDVTSNPYILFVGRLDDPRKNVGFLLEAFSRLPSHFNQVRLVTAGSGRPPQEYWEQVETRGLQNRVSHVQKPELDALVKLYQNASVFALSSDEEGLGMVILEAMSCGVPVVATACGGPDGIIDDGVDGYLVPLSEPDVMMQRLGELLSDVTLNLRMGKNARIKIETRYAEHVAGAAFVNVWNSLVKSRIPE